MRAATQSAGVEDNNRVDTGDGGVAAGSLQLQPDARTHALVSALLTVVGRLWRWMGCWMGWLWLVATRASPSSSPTSTEDASYCPPLYTSTPRTPSTDGNIRNPHQDGAIEAEEDAHATAVAHAVLFSPDLWPQLLWQCLDRSSKRALRGVSVAMRDQVDGCITAVASPVPQFSDAELSRAVVHIPVPEGCVRERCWRLMADRAIILIASPGTGSTGDELRRALVRWPNTTDLALVDVKDEEATSALQPLVTITPLGGITLLQVSLHWRACRMRVRCQTLACCLPLHSTCHVPWLCVPAVRPQL